jgi:hypothetical protein
MRIKSGLKTIGLMTCLAMALHHLSGCAFSQWTEHYYFGDAIHKPVYSNRVSTGVAILPFALVGDVVTAPIQLLLLVFKGDDFLYRKSTVVGQNFFTSREEKASSSALASLSPSQRTELEEHVASQIEALDGSSQKVTALGVLPDGSVQTVSLSGEALEQLRSRAPPEQIYPDSLCAL